MRITQPFAKVIYSYDLEKAHELKCPVPGPTSLPTHLRPLQYLLLIKGNFDLTLLQRQTQIQPVTAPKKIVDDHLHQEKEGIDSFPLRRPLCPNQSKNSQPT